MAENYWNHQSLLKRQRPDYDLPPSGHSSSHEMHNYLAQDDGRGGSQGTKDTNILQSAYDRYLQAAVPSKTISLTSGENNGYDGAMMGRTVASGQSGYFMNNSLGMGHSGAVSRDHLPIADQAARYGADGHDHLARQAAMARSAAVGQDRRMADPLMAHSGLLGPNLVSNVQTINYDMRSAVEKPPSPSHKTAPLPRDATNTLFVEGLPPNCRRREVAHIFRPFVGYKEVRIVTKDPKYRGRDPLILCFVDFESPACAATAMSALQGYRMDEHDSDSGYLRLQFSRHPGPRSGSGSRYGSRGKR